jgi:hypothetical protein
MMDVGADLRASCTDAVPVRRRATQSTPMCIACLALVLFILGVPYRANAQAGDHSTSGHGWAVIEDTRTDDATRDAPRWVIVHLPPAAPGKNGAGVGVVRPAERLQRRPERLAWTESNLYFSMPSETIISDGRRQLRRVYSMYAERSLAGTWMYVPLDGPGFEPSLPGEGELVGFVGAGGGRSGATTGERDIGGAPAALIYLGPDSAAPIRDPGNEPDSGVPIARAHTSPLGGAWRLLVLVGQQWMDVPLPWQVPMNPGETPTAEPLPALAEAALRVHLLSTPNGIGVLVIGEGDAAGRATWLTTRLKASGVTQDGAESMTWTVNSVWDRETLTLGADPLGDVVSLEGRPMSLNVKDGVLTARLLFSEGPVEVARKEGVGSSYQIVPRGGSQAVMSVIWVKDADSTRPKNTGDAPKPDGRAKRELLSFGFFEFFATGRVLYDGPAKQDGLLSVRQVQLIAALLGGILLAVTIFVLKPEKSPSERLLRALPKGMIPAAVGRRLIASLIDAGLGFIVAKSIIGVDWGEVMELVFTGSLREWSALAGATLGMTWLLATLGEWQLGRSIGKWLVDCRVVSLRLGLPEVSVPDGSNPGQDLGRLQLWQSMVRNGLKWIPPFSLTVLLGPRTRHFADQVAGTMVVEQEAVEPDNEA